MDYSFTELSQLLFGNELLASRSAVANALNMYNLAVVHGAEYVGLTKRPDSYNTITGSRVYKGTDGENIGILNVKGNLVYEESVWESLCGMTSYEGLQNKATHMIKDRGVKHLILEINSGGGMAYGCFETAMAVKNLAKENNVKITSYVDGVAYSGGYAWCCIADEVIVNPMGRVGSIGVVLPLVNYSEAEKKEGIQRVYVTAGKSKVPYDKDGKFTEEALSDMKEGVMEVYGTFVEHVASNRGISSEAVENTEAKLFTAKKGLDLGLIDSIMTKEELYTHIGNFNGENPMSLVPNKDDANVQTPKDEAKVNAEKGAPEVASADSAVISNLTAKISASDAEVMKLNADLGTANEKIQNLEAQMSALAKEKADAIDTGRRDRISALVADDQVEFHMSMVEGADPEKFDKYVAHLAGTQAKIEAGFEEQGSKVADDSSK